FALLGSSKIFQTSGRFDLSEPYTNLISAAWRDGIRVSSNSWGEARNEYSLDAQEYDARVRDAVPSLQGSQEMVICFAAGNAGPDQSINSPGSAKNVIAVGASENLRGGGEDGCGVEDLDADNAHDMAFFSSGGPLFDGRSKPDIVAPGTHVQGAASQHEEYDGTTVCGEEFGKPYFPRNQTLYTWSSGTSHSTPVVAGAAALARQFFLNRGQEPSAALIKALLVNTATYMTGEGAGGNLPHPVQGWGLLNIGRAFDSASKILIDQSHTFSDSGQEFVITGEIRDTSLPFRVTLAWSDAPGFSAFAPWVNNLDLEVIINGRVYAGNNFKGQESQPGGEPNTKDNLESVWLPAGTAGTFAIRIRAQNIAGDGVPGNADPADQDFALVVYNGERKDVAVATLESISIAGGSDSAADPGETVTMKVTVKNHSPVALSGGQGNLTTRATGVSITRSGAEFPQIAGGASGETTAGFEFTIDRSVACGSSIDFVLEIGSGGSTSVVPIRVKTGNSEPVELFSDDMESGEAKWTHGSLVKKKKNRIDTWTIASKRFRSGSSAWFTPSPGKPVDANLDTISVQLPQGGRDLQLIFYHTFEFERGRFDGGVIEISAGGDFEDLGPKIVRGEYNGEIRRTSSNALGGRPGWVEGRVGPLQQVVVDLSSYAGRTVRIRFRIGTDQNVKGIGWFIDDVRIAGERVSCAN
ncbi:MAG TPA: S8 family serine peptidase, partial [Blastocatellia bacterium]|nr:S8 family serine peptidase [Blastocatellia bacterium]